MYIILLVGSTPAEFWNLSTLSQSNLLKRLKGVLSFYNKTIISRIKTCFKLSQTTIIKFGIKIISEKHWF